MGNLSCFQLETTTNIKAGEADPPANDQQWVMPLYDPLPMSGKNTQDLLLANGIWQRWLDSHHCHYVTLAKTPS